MFDVDGRAALRSAPRPGRVVKSVIRNAGVRVLSRVNVGFLEQDDVRIVVMDEVPEFVNFGVEAVGVPRDNVKGIWGGET